MIIVRHVQSFIQICILDDKAESYPQTIQHRVSYGLLHGLACFIERKVKEAQFIRDNYHEDVNCKTKYHQGNAEGFLIVDCSPIVLISNSNFVSFKLVFGDECLSGLCMNDLLEIAAKLKSIE